MAEHIGLVGLSISVFTLISILARRKLSMADGLLCLWLVVIGIPMLRTMYESFLSPVYNPTFNLLHGPILYIYVRLLTGERPEFKWSDLWHLAPFVLLYMFSFPFGGGLQMLPAPSVPGSEAMVQSANSVVAAMQLLLLHFGLLNALSFLSYSLVVGASLIKHQRKIAGYYSSIDAHISLKWIYLLPALFLVITVINLVNESASVSFIDVQPLTLHILSHCCLAVLLCFFGVQQKPVFKVEPEVSVVPEPVKLAALLTEEAASEPQVSKPVEEKPESGPGTPLLAPPEVEACKVQIHKYMTEEKPYLDPDFSVYALAERLDIPRRTLSFVLSSGFNKNFYQFVNNYRLEEVKAKLSDVENKETIMAVAFACGFNTKSTFNTLFKKQCGCTPTQYRKQARAQ